MHDLHPAATRTAAVIRAVGDAELNRPTPCPDSSVGGLIVHLASVAGRLAASARRTTDRRDVLADGLVVGWRDRGTELLHDLADAWGDCVAWDGTTLVRGRETPAKVLGLVALDELVIHGWDIAVATGQPYEVADADVDVLTRFVTRSQAPRDGTLFGPVVDVAEAASGFDRLLGLTGRDPAWAPFGL